MHKSIDSEFPLSAFSTDQEFVEMQTSTALLIGHNEHIPDAPHPLSGCTASPECRRPDFHFQSILQPCVYGQSQSSYVLSQILTALRCFERRCASDPALDCALNSSVSADHYSRGGDGIRYRIQSALSNLAVKRSR